jgi:phosphatidylserine decarboxylase
MPDVTRVRDRRTGTIFEEKIFGGDTLHLLYDDRRVRWLTDHVLTGAWANRLYGRLQRSRRSARKIPDFVRTLGIDASEAELPLTDYRSLDDFFTRRLRPGARPIEPAPQRLGAAADARVLVVPEVLRQRLRVKGSEVDLDDLVGDPALAARWRGGAALIGRLAPADYHRFHFPDDGTAGPAHAVPGRLHSVHPIALAAGAPSLRNKRAITTLDSRGFGPLALIEVGALLVGTIEQHYRPGPVRRGDEKGLFRFGGSTVIVLAAAGRLRADDDLLAASADGLETLVRMGEGLATAAAP